MPTKELTGLEIAHLIERRFPDAVEEAQPEFAMIAPDRLVEVMTWLRDDEDQQFKFLSSLTGVDREDWFEVAYHLESIKFNRMTAIKVRSWDRENPVVPSVVSVWQGAHLQEREAYDLLGIALRATRTCGASSSGKGSPAGRCGRTILNLPGGQMPGLEHFPGRARAGADGTGDGMTLKSEPVEVNIGPQHPSTHGVFRMVAKIDGERIVDVKMVVGYLHRSMEKLAEERTYTQNIPFTDRMDYLAAMTGNLGYCLSVEKLAGIEVPERAQYLRVIFAELQRVASHCMATGAFINDCGAWQTPVMYMLPRPREGARPVRDDLRRAPDDELHAHRRRRLRHPRRVPARARPAGERRPAVPLRGVRPTARRQRDHHDARARRRRRHAGDGDQRLAQRPDAARRRHRLGHCARRTPTASTTA